MMAAALAAGMGVTVRAAPSGLALMPTADLVPGGEFVVEAQVDGSLEDVDADTRFLNFQTGLGDRMEWGVDYDASRETEEYWLLNAKLLVWGSASEKVLIAAGFRNLGDEEEPEGYAVGTLSLGAVRAHAGATVSEARNLDGVVGLDVEWSPGWWAYGEWTSGKENAGSVGLNMPLPGPLDLMTGIILPNRSEEDVGYTVHLVWSGAWPDFRRQSKE